MKKIFKSIISLVLSAIIIFALIPELTLASSSSHVTISVSPRELSQSGNVTVSITLTNTNSSSATPAPTAQPTQPAQTTQPTQPAQTTQPTQPAQTTQPTAAPTEVPATPTPTPEPTATPTEAPTEPPVTPEPTPDPGEGKTSVGGSGLGYGYSPSFGASLLSTGSSYGSAYTNITIANSYGVAFSTYGVTVPAGTQKTFTGAMHVTDAMLGQNLTFTVNWKDGGESRSETVTCKVNRRSASVYLLVNRTATPVNAAEGTEVTFKYTFTNTGSVTLTNIALVDKYVYGSTGTMYSISSLEPGASKDFEYVLTMGKNTILSSPVVTFYAQGGSTQLVNNVTSLTIGLIQSQLSKDIVQGAPTPQGVQFTLYLINNGNQKLSSLTVTDETGAVVSEEPFSLAVGETKVIEYFVPNPDTVRYVIFNIEGEDLTGTEFKDSTKSYVVRPYIDKSLLGLSFTAVTTTQLSPENVIGILFSVENTGALDFYNLSIREQAIDHELQSWDTLAVGESDKVELNVNIDAVRNLVFILTAEDSSGNVYTHEAYVTAESIDVGEMIPTDDPANNEGDIDVEPGTGIGKKLDGLITSTGEKLMRWFRVLGIIAAIAALAMIILGVTEIVIRRNKRHNEV